MYWLALAPSAWRDGIQVGATGMCTIYLLAVRRMLPHAQLAVDLFHVVQLANKTLGDVRRRATHQKYGRRGKSGDPEYCTGAWTAAQPRGTAPGPGRQTRGHARCRRAWPADRHRLDR